MLAPESAELKTLQNLYGKVNKVIADNSAITKKQTVAAKSAASGFAGLASSVKTLVSGATVAGVIALGKKLVGVLNDVGAEYGRNVAAAGKLTAAARDNPYLNGGAVQSVQEYAKEVSRATAIESNRITRAAAEQAALGRTEKQLKSMMLAAGSGKLEYESAYQALSRSYDGNVSAFKKLISEFGALSAEELKNGAAVDIVNTKYAGMAAQLAGTREGEIAAFNNAVNDMRANLGWGLGEGYRARAEGYNKTAEHG